MEKVKIKEFEEYYKTNSREFEEFRKVLIRKLEDCEGYADIIEFSSIINQSILDPLQNIWKK